MARCRACEGVSHHTRAPGGRALCASPTAAAEAARATPPTGETAADARAPRRRPDHVLAAGHRRAVVWSARTPCRHDLCHRRLIPLGSAAGADPLGAHPRSDRSTFAPQALLSTRVERDPAPDLTWFMQRWPLETTCEEARATSGSKRHASGTIGASAARRPHCLGVLNRHAGRYPPDRRSACSVRTTATAPLLDRFIGHDEATGK